MKNEIKVSNSIADACVRSCKEIASQLATARNAILGQFIDRVAGREHTLQLALNEAEALAWETEYPQLVFPDLAEEKARGVMNWMTHQHLVQAHGFVRA